MLGQQIVKFFTDVRCKITHDLPINSISAKKQSCITPFPRVSNESSSNWTIKFSLASNPSLFFGSSDFISIFLF